MDSLQLLSEIQSLEDAIQEGVPDLGLRRPAWYAIQRIRSVLNDTEMDLLANDERTVENATNDLVNAALTEINGELSSIASRAGAVYKKQLRSIKLAFEEFRSWPEAKLLAKAKEEEDVRQYFANPPQQKAPVIGAYDPDDAYVGAAIYHARTPDEADTAVKDIQARRKRETAGKTLPNDLAPPGEYVLDLMRRIWDGTYVAPEAIKIASVPPKKEPPVTPRTVVAPPPVVEPVVAPVTNDLMAFLTKMDQKIDGLGNQMVQMEERLTERIDQVETRLDKKIDDVEQRLIQRIDKVERDLTVKIELVETQLRRLIDQTAFRLDERIDQTEARINRQIYSFESRLIDQLYQITQRPVSSPVQHRRVHTAEPELSSVSKHTLPIGLYVARPIEGQDDRSVIMEQRGPPI